MEKDMKLRKFIATTIREYLNEQKESLKNVKLNDNFWKWFGNSKVVDNDDNPQIFYHGTDAYFNEFKIDHKLQKFGWTEGKGFYFSKIKPHAYGKNIIACYLKIEKPIYGLNYIFNKVELSKLGFYDKPLVKKETTEYGTYITIQTHPLLPPTIDLNTDENTSIENYKPVIKPITYKGIIGMFAHLYPKFDIVDSIKNKLNYDGVIFNSIDNSNVICVVFYENNIKSIENDGTWDINDNNIYS